MKVNVSPQMRAQVGQLAEEVYRSMVVGYSFDGFKLEKDVEVDIRDTIIERMVNPDQLLRLKLRYSEDGPSDRWRAACEMILGGGLVHNGHRFRVLGAGSGLKDGAIWMATDAVRTKLHRYFSSAQEALSYSGVFFSKCIHGIWKLNNLKGRVVRDGQFGTADGMGFISNHLVQKLGLPTRQAQVRLVSNIDGKEWLGKGTLVSSELSDGLDFILPKSMIKGKGYPDD